MLLTTTLTLLQGTGQRQRGGDAHVPSVLRYALLASRRRLRLKRGDTIHRDGAALGGGSGSSGHCAVRSPIHRRAGSAPHRNLLPLLSPPEVPSLPQSPAALSKALPPVRCSTRCLLTPALGAVCLVGAGAVRARPEARSSARATRTLGKEAARRIEQ